MHHSGLKTGLRALLITALTATVGACGMKGALYLPEQQPQSQPQSQLQPQAQPQKPEEKKDSQDKKATDTAPDAATTNSATMK